MRLGSVSAEAGSSADMAEADELELGTRKVHRRALGLRTAAEQGTGGNVLHHRHLRERLHDLERAGEPAPRRLERVLARHVLAGEADRAGGGLVDAGDEVDERRLPRPVRADEADDLALLQRERDVVGRLDAAERLGDVVEGEDAHARVSFGAMFRLPERRFSVVR